MTELYPALRYHTSWRSRRQGEAAGLPNLGESQGSQEASPFRGVWGCACIPSPAQPSAWLCHAWEVTSAAPGAMATCRKRAAGRAGLGNLKQH